MLNFLGLGAQKAGTTWLYAQLCRHPDIAFPLGKEGHFWNSGQYHPSNMARLKEKSIADYAGKFNSGRINGEITPAYSVLPAAIIEQIYNIFPHLRLIFILRDPIARAWSSALMAVEMAMMTPDEASDQWFIDHFHSKGSFMRGDYAAALDNWLKFFPREQMLLLQYADIAGEPEAILRKVAAHLNINADALITDKENLRIRIFAGHPHPLRPTLLPVLQELYAEPLKRLKNKYGIEFS